MGARVTIIERGEVIAKGALDELIQRHGGASVELTFDGSPPDLGGGHRTVVSGSVLRVATDDSAAAAAGILASLGAHAETLRAVEIITPSLESVYLTLTGHRYRGEEDSAEDALAS